MIPTAKDFAWNQEEDFKTILTEINYQEVYKLMIEFAKLHVEAALKAASKQDYVLDSDKAQKSILNAYPLTNIK